MKILCGHVVFIVPYVFFRKNNNSGAYITHSSNTLIQNSVFENNLAFSHYTVESDTKLKVNYTIGGGLTLISTKEDKYTEISNCIFRDNQAGINESNCKDAEQRPQQYVPRGHGGGFLILFQTAVRHKVVIRDCNFSRNTANLTGGAISIQFYRGSANSDVSITSNSLSSSNNTVEIENTIFEDNSSEKGGAICINTFEAANYNEVILRRSVFHENNATISGGALSFNIQVQFIQLSR